MCTSFHLKPTELLAKWFTYSAGKNDTDLTMAIIDDFNKVFFDLAVFMVLSNLTSDEQVKSEML